MRKESDRRKWERLPLPVPIFVRGKDSNGESFLELTVAENIGGGGLVFASNRSLPRSARLTLQIPSVPWLEKVGRANSTQPLKGHVIRTTCAKDVKHYAFQFKRPLIGTRSRGKTSDYKN